MKKILVILLSVFLSCNTLAYEFNNNKEYNIKNKKINNTPKVMHFFSFFCPYCYELEKIYNISKLIQKNIHKDINVETYHINFLGGKLSYALTKSWIIAQQIGIEEKIILPIFQGVQKTHTINDIDSIKKIFHKKAGISETKFNSFWNSLTLKILVKRKNNDVKKSHIDSVPTMLINGKYIINYEKIEDSFKNNFSEKYIKLIHFLINKK